jgi:hypothetical protein
MSGFVVPFDCPPRSELWRRIRVAESILEHRSIVPETTRLELLKVLRGELFAVNDPKEVS